MRSKSIIASDDQGHLSSFHNPQFVVLRRRRRRKHAGAHQHRRSFGQQQRALFVGSSGAGDLRQAWRCSSAHTDPRRIDLGRKPVDRRDSSGVYVWCFGARSRGPGRRYEMLTSISRRVSWKLIASPQIKRAEDLRGKRFGVQSVVGSIWMYAMLALEQLGLEPKRDNISFLPIGDPVTIGHALEAGRIDAAVLDPTLSQRLMNKGFTQLVDLAKTSAIFPGLGVGVTRAYLEQHANGLEKLVAALTEGLVFVHRPANKSMVLKILMKHLRINDPSVAESGYQDHLLTLNRKPYPSLDGLRNAQRLMAQENPKVAALKVEELVDARFVRQLDESGFIDRLYAQR